jgi:hypothetical protein
MLALGKAKAAAGLLEEIQRSTQVPTMALATLDRDGWLTTIAMDALHAALEEARMAFVKHEESVRKAVA